MSKKMRSNILLLTAALIWGSAFVAQKSGMDYIEPFTFNGIRTFIGGLVLIPVILFMSKTKVEAEKTPEERKLEKRNLFLGGGLCGIILFAASSLQQFGVVETDAGKAGFITTLYVVMVPIFALVIGKKVRKIIWLCVVLGAVGMYLLCIKAGSGFSLEKGDFLVFLCAIIFAVHILVIDHFSPKVDGVKMSCIQFLVAGVLGLTCMLIFENPDITNILSCWLPILYAGVLSCGVAYTLQIIAQKDADPTVATLILSLESVFAVIAGAIILRETMSARELMGCAIIFAAVIIAQLPSKKDKQLS